MCTVSAQPQEAEDCGASGVGCAGAGHCLLNVLCAFFHLQGTRAPEPAQSWLQTPRLSDLPASASPSPAPILPMAETCECCPLQKIKQTLAELPLVQ